MKCVTHKTKQRADQGFTLIEIMIGVLLLSILVIGSAASLMHVKSSITMREQQHLAQLYATSVMEAYTTEGKRASIEQKIEKSGGTEYVTSSSDIVGVKLYHTVITVSRTTEAYEMQTTVTSDTADPIVILYAWHL